MGRVQADLPDMSQSDAGSDATDADDLLAQLAGDEVDKMLAEAEVETPPMQMGGGDGAAPQSDPAAASIAEKELAKDLDALMSEMDQRDGVVKEGEEKPAAPENANDASTAPEPVDAGEQETTAITEQVAARESANAETGTQTSAVAQSEESSALPSDDAPVSATEDPAETSQAGDEAPAAVWSSAPSEAPAPEQKASEVAAKVLEPAASSESAEPAHEENSALPWYVRLLEIINSPFNVFPDAIREAMGKVAIATLLNAVVVIGYVFLFRKR